MKQQKIAGKSIPRESSENDSNAPEEGRVKSYNFRRNQKRLPFEMAF